MATRNLNNSDHRDKQLVHTFGCRGRENNHCPLTNQHPLGSKSYESLPGKKCVRSVGSFPPVVLVLAIAGNNFSLNQLVSQRH